MEVDIERAHRVEMKKKPEAGKKIRTAQDHCLSPKELEREGSRGWEGQEGETRGLIHLWRSSCGHVGETS